MTHKGLMYQILYLTKKLLVSIICSIFSDVAVVFQIGKAAPPSPSRDRRKDVGSPLRNPGSPMRKNSQSDRRYLQIIHCTPTETLAVLTLGGAVSTGRRWRRERGLRRIWTDTRSGCERFDMKRIVCSLTHRHCIIFIFISHLICKYSALNLYLY